MRGAADVKQLEEAKETLEGQLEEIQLQLERDGYTSVAQMRCMFVSGILRNIRFDCLRGHHWTHGSLNPGSFT